MTPKRLEVLFGNRRIQGIHAPPRRLSQLVTTFVSSRAEPFPSQVVASFGSHSTHFLCESSGVQEHAYLDLIGHHVSPKGGTS